MSEQELSTEAVDRISSLPDDILIHILSSVSTKQAFVTSILSKRWIHLWLYVPVLVLDFSETKLKDQESFSHFEEFIISVLSSRESAGNHSIDTFILHGKTYTPRLHSLVVGNSSQFRTSIIACTTLVVLKLRRLCFLWPYHSQLNLPSLKTLHLKDMYFPHQHELMRLLNACPVLEELQLSKISDGNLKYYTRARFGYFKSSSMLRKLNRADITACDCYFVVKSLSNLEFLRIQLSKVDRPYDFPTFYNLTHLVLNYDWDIVVQVLHHCPKLQNLELYQKLQEDKQQYKDFTIKYWVYPKSVPSCVSLNLTTCTMRDFALFGLQRNHIMLARFLLENASVLETMSIWSKNKQSEIESQLSPCPRASATCQLSFY